MNTKYCISKGYDILLKGNVKCELHCLSARYCYVSPSDFRWLIPKLLVAENDDVTIGTPLLADKTDERIVIVSPVAGKVKEIVRGEKRKLENIIIEINSEERAVKIDVPSISNRQETLNLLLKNGLFSLIRQRPFSVIPNPDTTPKAIFISCFDSSPLAPDYNFLLKNRIDEFQAGIQLLKNLCQSIGLCLKADYQNEIWNDITGVEKYYFQGPHPSGNVGTQIHKISPINKGETVWYLRPQEVATMGRLVLKSELCFEKMVALTGPCATNPAYWQMVYGEDCSELFQNENSQNVRKISGNVLTGKKMEDFPSVRFYDEQITLIPEGGERELIGWLLPGLRKWSFSHTFLAWLFRNKKYDFSTSLQGGHRNFVMSDVYDKVFPFDIIPLALLKACMTQDIEMMENLGIYEVDDEDFALCEVVCPSKMECQQIIREGLYYIKNN